MFVKKSPKNRFILIYREWLTNISPILLCQFLSPDLAKPVIAKAFSF